MYTHRSSPDFPSSYDEDVHLRFTAIKLEDKTEPPVSDGELSSQTYTENELELEEKIVFINNLPIDITEDEVDEIYSRCGPLDSIQLFNRALI